MPTDAPSVDWLDPARESCLIDGVRYRRVSDGEIRAAFLAGVRHRREVEMGIIADGCEEACADDFVYKLTGRLVPIVSGPTGYAGLKVRTWECPDCGSEHDRDVNAAINTLLSGLGSSHERVGDGASETARVAGINAPVESEENDG